jgi:hypothetical protein
MNLPGGPLAYAFWHWKRPEIATAVYEARQRDFQAALAADPPPGFLGGTTARLTGASWAAAGGPAYEDWYLVTGMAALEQLNEAAVTAGRAKPHDAVAQLAAGGTAGLYGLRAGAALTRPAFAVWFEKRPGLSYHDLLQVVTPLMPQGASALWSRRMTLGPTPEFCLQASTPIPLPRDLKGQRFTLQSI